MKVTITDVGQKKIQVIKTVRAFAKSEADRELKGAKAIVDYASVSPHSFEVSDDNTPEGVRRAFGNAGATVSIESFPVPYVTDNELRKLVEQSRSIVNDWDQATAEVNRDPLLLEVFRYKLNEAHGQKLAAFHGLALA